MKLLAYPRVVCVNTETQIKLKAEKPLFAKGAFSVIFTKCEAFRNERSAVAEEIISDFPVCHTSHKPVSLPLTVEDGFTASLSLTLPGEQEYILRIVRNDRPGQVLASCFVYAVEADLQGLYPYKGDFHMHSWHSDGSNSPEVMAVCSREKGFDFMALTDHGKRQPSVYLQERFAKMPGLAMQIYTGEEVHLPYHQAHILNIGGTASVNETFQNDMDRFYSEVEQLQQTETIPENTDPYMYASALWAFKKIRQYGGMSVFCHPYWRRAGGYELCTDFTEAILKLQPFDALELISGYEKPDSDMNQLQVARYFELDRRPPIVGVSDSHNAYEQDVPLGCYLLGTFYTMVLAKSSRFEAVRDGILSGRSVAVEHIPHEQRHLYGCYRMVKYFQFLAREFFPEHDAQAMQEASAMAQLDEGARGRAGAMEEVYKKAFAW